MEQLDKLREWGYVVGGEGGIPSMEVEGVKVWHVDGFGLSTYVREDDTEGLDALSDPAAHGERVLQQSETPEETMARLAEVTPDG